MMSNSGYWENCYRNPTITGAQDYDGWLAAYTDDIQLGSRVLDLGCGTGTNIGALLSFDAELTAADFSENAIGKIRAAYAGSPVKADCFDMRNPFPYADESFDVVVADLSLHYFSYAETQTIVGEIRRILRKGGKLIARVHSMANLQNPNVEKLEENYYIVDGFPRRYFTAQEINSLFGDWKTLRLDACSIHRYHKLKQVFELSVQKA